MDQIYFKNQITSFVFIATYVTLLTFNLFLSLAQDENKSCFVCLETQIKNWQYHLKLWRREHANLPKDLLTEKLLLVTKDNLSICNSKQYEQLGEVKPAATILSRNSLQGTRYT